MEFRSHELLLSTHSIEDGQARYYVEATGQPLQAIADAFLRGYHVEPDADDGEPVAFTIASIGGKTLGAFKGRPDQPATRVA